MLLELVKSLLLVLPILEHLLLVILFLQAKVNLRTCTLLLPMVLVPVSRRLRL